MVPKREYFEAMRKCPGSAVHPMRSHKGVFGIEASFRCSSGRLDPC